MTTTIEEISEQPQPATRAEVPPRSDVGRVSSFAIRSDDGSDGESDGLTLDGFASVFNRTTLIDSWEGRFREMVAPGSMKKSFRETPPKIQFDHGRHPMIGSIPIAKLERIAEEVDPELAPEGGAHVVARMFDNYLVQPVRDAISAEAIDGMSFRFEVMKEQWFDPESNKVIRDEDVLRELLRRSWMENLPEEQLLVRTLKDLKVPELGPVVWPAYTDTSVMVRNAEPGSSRVVIDLSRLADPDERRKIADVTYLAERAEVGDLPDFPADEQEATPDEGADDHSDTRSDTQQGTDATPVEEQPAAEHESEHTEPKGLREAMNRWSASRAVTVENAARKL